MSELAQLTALELDQLSLDQGEPLAEERSGGVYSCKNCDARLYLSDDKFIARVRWPSFRHSLPGAVREEEDNSFGLRRRRVVCAQCTLHLGHLFNDGKVAGDAHPNAKDRHCILSVCLKFNPDPSMKEVPPPVAVEISTPIPRIEANVRKSSAKAESILGKDVSHVDSKRSVKEGAKSLKNTSLKTAGWSWTDYFILGGVTVVVSVGVAFALKYFLKDDKPSAEESLRRDHSISATDASFGKGR
jgi:peptide methionine sulfoxide reductase MsrB